MRTAAAALVAAVDPTGPNADKVSPGLLGFITVFCLALAVVVLVRSMTKHLRKVRYSPGPDGEPWTPPGSAGIPQRDAAAGPTVSGGTAAGAAASGDEGPQAS